MKNRRSFLEKSSDGFLFFSDVFRKMSDVFMSFFPRFLKVDFSLQKNVAEKSCFFLFSCRKNASFQHSCVKVVKAKKCKSQGTRPRVTCAREKPLFSRAKYDAHHESLIETKSPRFLPPLLQHFSPQKWVDSFKLSEDGWHSHQDTMISPREFALELHY